VARPAKRITDGDLRRLLDGTSQRQVARDLGLTESALRYRLKDSKMQARLTALQTPPADPVEDAHPTTERAPKRVRANSKAPASRSPTSPQKADEGYWQDVPTGTVVRTKLPGSGNSERFQIGGPKGASMRIGFAKRHAEPDVDNRVRCASPDRARVYMLDPDDDREMISRLRERGWRIS
jgi:hypothetical protein